MTSIFERLLEAPSQAWLSLLGVIIGAAISVFGGWLTNRAGIKRLNIELEHKRRIQAIDVRREKLEELYILVDKWMNRFCNHYLKINLVMRGEMDYNQYLDETIEDDKSEPTDFTRLQMIIDIYGEELQSSFKAILKAREELNKISSAHKVAYKQGDFDGQGFTAFSSSISYIDIII